jgi:phenylalanyl-tRNA synthetase beta subunit
MIPGLLKTISSNKSQPLPLRVFEIGDVVLRDQTSDVGAHNERRISAVLYGHQPDGKKIRASGFEVFAPVACAAPCTFLTKLVLAPA